ncbi:MAG TPA: hypothetical protein VF595_15120 [Tepidisphaeraceae bacterium]
MARVVDYAVVLQHADTLGLRCVYYNTGAFGFAAGQTVHVVGWLGPEDASIRSDLLATTLRVPPPYPKTLAERFGQVWPDVVGGEAWVLPKSHWAFELDHGNGPWLAPALTAAGVDPDMLRGRTDGSAVAFTAGDPACLDLIQSLLTHLTTSDFAVLFPGHRHLVTIHHHQQLWWQTAETQLVEKLQKQS